jgi:hypothetical protein
MSVPPDPHLQAALRHAPDAGIEAPAALRARLLAEAQRAVARPLPAPREGKPAWAWLRSGLRMPAGAFATLLIGGVVALLWQGTAPGPAVESTRVAEAAPAPAVPALPPAPQQTAEPPRDPAAALPAPAAPAAPPAPATPAARARQSAPMAAPPVAATRQADTTTPETARAEAAAAAPAAAPPAAVQDSLGQGAAPSANRAATAEKTAADSAPMAAAMPAPMATFRRAAAPPQAPQTPQLPPPWGTPLPERDRWVGQPNSVPVDPQRQAQWLALLAAQAAAPWSEAPLAVASQGPPTLDWQRDGAPYGRLWLQERGSRWWMLWCAAGEATCREAPLKALPPR